MTPASSFISLRWPPPSPPQATASFSSSCRRTPLPTPVAPCLHEIRLFSEIRRDAFSALRSKADASPPLDPAASSQIPRRSSPSARELLSRILQLLPPRPTNTISVAPKHVSQMFALLQGSTEPHVVVASLASDKNIWEAVMKNNIIEFSRSPPPIVFHTISVDPAEGVVENKFPEGPSRVETEETFERLMFIDIVDNLKTKVFGELL